MQQSYITANILGQVTLHEMDWAYTSFIDHQSLTQLGQEAEKDSKQMWLARWKKAHQTSDGEWITKGLQENSCPLHQLWQEQKAIKNQLGNATIPFFAG